MSKRTRIRRWPLRLLQLSPLLVLLVLAGIWFSIPEQAAVVLATSSSQPEYATSPMTPEIRVRTLDTIDKAKIADDLNLDWQEDSFNTAAVEAWKRWVDSLPVRPQVSDVLSPTIQTDAAQFEPVAKWERENGARVWAWVVPAPPQPASVASATGDPGSLRALEAQLRGQQASGGRNPGPAPQSVADLLWMDLRGGMPATLRPLDPSELQLGGSVNGGGGGYYTADYGLRDDAGRLWRAFVVGTPKSPENPVPEEAPADALNKADPAAADLTDRIQEIAKAEKVNIWVVGPMEWDAIPLRIPEGASAQQARELGELVWPAMGVRDLSYASVMPELLSDRVKALSGGAAGLIDATGVNNTGYRGGTIYAYDEVQPQTVAWLVVYDELPEQVTAAATGSVWLAWRRFVSAWFPFLLGGAVGLLALTLVASPSAFVYERRLIARERVREEMARMRRDAHDKVYNRLSALSKRVAAAGDQVAADTAAALSSVAEEIRVTVGELQEILGDEARHTNVALTTVPVADQLASVAAAQAARLGVAVRVTAADGLPEVAPDLGWDLQCVTEEAITNSVRHGAAAHVGVVLAVEDGALVLTVSDDGRGSEITRPQDAPVGSTGLRGISERLEKWHGELTMATSEEGAVLRARVPLS